MSDILQRLSSRFEGFTLRERVMVTCILVLVLYAIWDLMLMAPEHKKQALIIEDIQSVEHQAADVSQHIRDVSSQLTGDRERVLADRVQNMRRLVGKTIKKEQDLMEGFIPPKRMTRVLQDLLNINGKLTLGRLESLGVSPLVLTTDEQAPTAQSQVYKHGIRMVFEGDFFTILKYLQAVEAMPWNLYWDKLDYHVLSYPQARVTLTVHTLSLHEGWIGV